MKTSIRPRKKKRSEPKGKNIKRLGRSIEKRDPSVLFREAFGHWEVDLVLIRQKDKRIPCDSDNGRAENALSFNKEGMGKECRTNPKGCSVADGEARNRAI